MLPRNIAVHLRNIPRPAALTRPSYPLHPSLSACRAQLPPIRNYSATPTDAAEASSSAQSSGSSSGSSPPQAWENERNDAESKIAGLEAKVKDLERDLLYNRAEVQTMSRRVSEERQKASDFAIASFARELLSLYDVLATALSHVRQTGPAPADELKQLFQGVDLTRKHLLKTFEQHGVKPFEGTMGAKFDPNLHEAVFQLPKDVAPKREGKALEGGEVFEVSKEGWMIGARVLRPAQVGVTQME